MMIAGRELTRILAVAVAISLAAVAVYSTAGPLTSLESEPQFNPPHEALGIDRNGDGRFDILQLSIGILTVQGTQETYVIHASVYYRNNPESPDPDSTVLTFIRGPIDQTIPFVPPPGDSVKQLDLSVILLAGSGFSGSWSVHLDLEKSSNRETVDTDDFFTPYYDSSVWAPLPTQFTGPFSDWAQDTNGDGKKELLTVNVTFAVSTGGQYAIAGYLHNNSQNAMMSNASYPLTQFTPGTYTEQLNFNVTGHSAYPGPYYVIMRIINDWPVYANETYDWEAYQTATTSLGG